MTTAIWRHRLLPLIVAPLLLAAAPPEIVVLADAPSPIGGGPALPLVAGDALPVVSRRDGAVEVATAQGRVWLPTSAGVLVGDGAADAVLFAQAREHLRHQRQGAALALYHVLSSRLPQSPYAPAALLGKGQVADALARAGGSAAAGRWGVRLDPVGAGRWRYDGAAYAEFLSRYPKHPLAEEALYSQIRADIDWAGPWRSASQPLSERRRWEFFLTKYPNSPYKPAAWLRWSYLTVVAAELAEASQPEQAIAYRRAAEARLRETVHRFRGGEYAARARRALVYLGQGGRVYTSAGALWPYESRF